MAESKPGTYSLRVRSDWFHRLVAEDHLLDVDAIAYLPA
jgi:hypothetical protein